MRTFAFALVPLLVAGGCGGSGSDDPADGADTTPPVISALLPSSWMLALGETSEVVVVASDEQSAIVAVKVGDQSGTTLPGAPGAYRVRAAPGESTLEVVNAAGLTTRQPLAIAGLPFIASGFHDLTTGEPGVAYAIADKPQPAIVAFALDGARKLEPISRDGVAMGPAIGTRRAAGMTYIAGTLYLGLAQADGALDVLAVDTATGARTLKHTCTFSPTASARGFIAVSPEEFYVGADDDLVRCVPGEAEVIADMTDEPSGFAGAMAHDSAGNRLIVPIVNGSTAVAVDLATKAVTTIATGTNGLAAALIVDGAVTLVERFGRIGRVGSGTTVDFVGEVASNTFSGVAVCGAAPTRLCSVNGSFVVAREELGVWSYARVANDDALGAPVAAARSTWTTFADDDVLGSVLVTDGVSTHRVRLGSGSVSAVPTGLNLSVKALPTGTVVALRLGKLAITRVEEGSAVVTRDNTASDIELVAAGTRGAEEAVLYAKGAELRLHALTSAEDTLVATAPTTIIDLAVALDGTAYVLAMGGLYRNAPGSYELVSVGAFDTQITDLVFDDRTNELVYAIANRVCRYDVTRTQSACVGMASDIGQVVPGPFAGTVLAALPALGDTLFLVNRANDSLQIVTR